MRNARLDEAQAEIKITGRNINNLKRADDTTLKAESDEELKSLLMKVKEESEKAGLKFNIHQSVLLEGSGEVLTLLGCRNICILSITFYAVHIVNM